MAYATVSDVQNRMAGSLSTEEQSVCAALLADAADVIDSYNPAADLDIKGLVSCRMVLRAIGDDGSAGIPIGASQGTMSALGYSQSWTIGGGSARELYLSKLDKKLLGVSEKIGSYSPVEELVKHD